MATRFRMTLLRSTAIAMLLAASATAASAQTVNGGGSTLGAALYEDVINNISPLSGVPYTYTPSGDSAAQIAFQTNTITDFGNSAPLSGSVAFAASDATRR